MRSRPNSRKPSGGNVMGAPNISQVEEDSNGKDKPEPRTFKRPPAAKFKLPPPPKMKSAVPNRTDNRIGAASKKSANTPQNGDSESAAATTSSTSALPPVQSIPMPPPPSSTSAVYQRPLRRVVPTSADVTTSVESSTSSVAATQPSGTTVPNTSYNSYTHANNSVSYQSHQYQQPTNHPNISHPYKPSSWYENARNVQRKREELKNVCVAILAITLVVLLWWGYYHLEEEWHNNDMAHNKKRHHKNYHHHDVHHFHPMLGIDESLMGFVKDEKFSNSNNRKQKRSYRQLEQHQRQSPPDRGQPEHTNLQHDIFTTFPVKTLSNGRLLPYVGFGVSSHSVEHKQIPIIVSTLLQYASSETEGGGGIAMIDAVIDEDRKLENTGGSMLYSVSNKVVERYEEEEEKVESSMAKTVVTLVGRAIGFFGNENSKRHVPSSQANSKSVASSSHYDYENRLEVHLLMGLSGPDLGEQNTIVALREYVAELGYIVPSIPKDIMTTDLTQLKTEPMAVNAADHNVDLRLHVLLRMNHCHNRSFKVAPCSSDEETNKELLDRWIGSYRVLERLYKANIIHGLGLDGIHDEDIKYLIKKCEIKPQLYRGDVAQALDIYGRRMGTFKGEHISHILKEHHITFLASNVAGHILDRKAMAPNAYALLQNLGGVLFRAHHAVLTAKGDTSMMSSGHKGEGQYYTVPRLVLSYLVRHKVCVLPHAFKAEHLADDAPESVGGLANFLSERRVAEIGAALRALLSENDLPEDHGLGMEGEQEIAAVFHNYLSEEVRIFRLDDNGKIITSSETEVTVKSGESVVIIAHANDSFEAFSSDGVSDGQLIVTSDEGGAVDFNIGNKHS